MTIKSTLEITQTRDQLQFGDGVRVSLQRTLRIPDDGKRYPLPPGLGAFPIRRVDDYADRVPDEWREHGGVFLPMYQREAMWILFQGPHHRPRAVQVGIGKVCAITGKRWSGTLSSRPQNYVVTPPQPWLDGIAAGRGTIRQFVAMPLGMGYTVEGQVTGEETFGGIQLKVYEPRSGRFPEFPEAPWFEDGVPPPMCAFASAGPPPSPAPARRSRGGAMGLGAGGRMKQKVYPDPHGIDTWDPNQTGRVFIHIVNTELWREITGEPAPATPVTAREYARAGLPWFDLYDETADTLSPTPALTGVKSIAKLDKEKSALPLQDDEPVSPNPVQKIAIPTKPSVRDGNW